MSIIRRLDLDADARLSLKEFIDGLTPNDPYSKCLKRLEINQQTRGTKAYQNVPEEPSKVLKKSSSVRKTSMTPSKSNAFIVKDCQMFGSSAGRSKSRPKEREPRKASQKPSIKNYINRSKSAKARKPKHSAKEIRQKKAKLFQKLREDIIEKYGKENVQKTATKNKQTGNGDDTWAEMGDFIKLSSKRRERRLKSAQKSRTGSPSKELQEET